VSTRSSARLLTNGIAVASAGAGVIHLAVAPAHLKEWLPFGVFFICLGIAQLAWSAFVWTRPTRRLVLAGAIANAGVVLLWLVSRSSGLPIGPEHWSPEAIGFPDKVCTSFEVLVVLGAALLLRGRDRELGRSGSAIARLAPVLVGAPLTVAAIVSATGVVGTGPMHM
jgi:hypothetical protein